MAVVAVVESQGDDTGQIDVEQSVQMVHSLAPIELKLKQLV